MSMVCPRCQQTFEQAVRCRTCECPLHFQADAPRSAGEAEVLEPAGPRPHTPWAKIGVGLVLALGLSYGLQQLCTAGLSAGSDGSNAGLWATLGGLLLLHALQGLSLLVGGAVTGAGQHRGVLYGFVVGVLSGALFVALQRPQADGLLDVLVFAQPVVHACFGMLGGLIGMKIWQPPPIIPLETRVPVTTQPSTPAASRLFHGPIHYGRVFTGVFIVVAGVVWSSAILQHVLHASNGALAITSHLQARLIGWEIAALATLLGAGVAGAATLNGFKQGLCVGVGAAVVMIGVQLGNEKLAAESFVGLLASVVALSAAGGWFGGQLFPPILPRRRLSSV